MSSQVTWKLDAVDACQILDGIKSRIESWRTTEVYLETGQVPPGEYCVEDCDSAEEARRIVEHYQSLADDLENQLGLAQSSSATP